MKIKTKLYLGVGLLFLLIFILNIVATYYINALKSDTENIIAANYKSLQYSRNMLSALQQKNRYDLKKFEASLIKQENNITEMGEAEITNELRDNYEELKTNISDTLFLISIHNNLFQIMDMNMHAIERKSDKAKRTADEAVLWIAMTGTLCFLIAFILLVNLPSNIANPIRELTESIKQIAANNYAERVHFESHSEYGQLATSFNTMAVKLEEYNKSNLAKIMMEKKRIETLINNMHDPVIGLDNDLMIIFANEEAINISGLKRSEFIGKSAQELGIKNDPQLHLAMELEKIAMEDDYFVSKKLYPNVDFYSGIIFRAIGIPTSMFTVLFAVARTVGWIAQWNEMISDPEQKIGRPRQLFIGEKQRDVPDLAKRP